MKIKRTFNVKLVESVLTDPIIWEAISGGTSDRASYTIQDKRINIYLLGYEDDELIGLAIVHPNMRKDWFCHFQVFKPKRKNFALLFAKSALEWIWSNTEIPNLSASIPVNHPNVKAFSVSMGFKEIGYILKTNKRYKHTVDRWLMKLESPVR